MTVTDTTALTTTTTTTTTTTSAVTRTGTGAAPSPPYRIGLRTLTLVDRSRTIRYPTGSVHPRVLVTELRYPIHARCPCPLVVFGHGFAVTPRPYTALLRAWARAGYVVAAPVFPLENAHAPGGPNEADLVNQPRDVSFVITQLTHRFPSVINSRQIAVSGQSDGGETALAVAYDVQFIDRRVRAAVILSGAKIPGVSGFTFPAPSPPLLATQGTADTVNPPHFTREFFDVAPRPKFLLWLLGAGHLPPYTTEQPQLRIVETVTTAFLDRYVRGERNAGRTLRSGGDVPGVARLTSLP